MRRWANSTRFFRSTRCRPGCEPNDPQVVEYTQWGRERAVATPFGVQGHSNLTNHHCGRCLRLSRNMITFDAALSTSKRAARACGVPAAVPRAGETPQQAICRSKGAERVKGR